MKKLFVSIFAFGFLFSGGFLNVEAADRDCGEFSSNEEVMDFWYSNDFSATNDPHDLDRDNDGFPCEVSSDEYNNYVASKKDSQEDDNDDTTTSTENDTTDDSASENSDSSTDSNSAEEGEQLPDTATNSVAMMGLSALLIGAGSLLIFRKKQTN